MNKKNKQGSTTDGVTLKELIKAKQEGNVNIKNHSRIGMLKAYMGGDNENVPLHNKALEDMVFIVEQCKKLNLPQPEIFPWAGGNGVQAEWKYDWYLEIDSSSNGVSILFVKSKNYENAINTNVKDIENAFLLVKEFLNNVVDLDGSR